MQRHASNESCLPKKLLEATRPKRKTRKLPVNTEHPQIFALFDRQKRLYSGNSSTLTSHQESADFNVQGLLETSKKPARCFCLTVSRLWCQRLLPGSLGIGGLCRLRLGSLGLGYFFCIARTPLKVTLFSVDVAWRWLDLR